MTDQKSNTLEEIKVRGNQLGERLREIIEEGNARRIIVKKEGRSVMEFPLSVGVGGAAAAIMLSPTVAAIGAFASLASDVRIVIERTDDTKEISDVSTPRTTAEEVATKTPATDPMAPTTPSAGKASSPAATSTKQPPA